MSAFAQAVPGGQRRAGLLASLPAMLAGGGLSCRRRGDCRRARRAERAIIWGIGAHVIKTGLSPILIDLMERGFVSAIATNGAGIIHDFEIALAGATSEDVDAALGPGRVRHGRGNGDAAEHARSSTASGEVSGSASRWRTFSADQHPPYERYSIAATAWRLEIPLTVHVAIGTDIMHMHPLASGAAHRRGQPARLPLFHVGGCAARAAACISIAGRR